MSTVVTDWAAPRWVFADGLAHVLADPGGADVGVLGNVTVCGLGLAATTTVYTVPPSLDMCRRCVPLPGSTHPPHERG
ncbi:MAG TPA: hypothetical protein VHH34_08640 [Pseudonocardiaceae bacterium]|nr:hypothetical protein [Pseudonocardiaceae bacterium]